MNRHQLFNQQRKLRVLPIATVVEIPETEKKPSPQNTFATKFLLFHFPLPFILGNYRHLPPYPAFLNNACFMSSEFTSVL